MRAAGSPKEEKGEGKGGPVWGTRAWGSRADRMPGQGETHNAQRRRVRHDAIATQKWSANGPDTDGVRRARSENNLASVARSTKHRARDMTST